VTDFVPLMLKIFETIGLLIGKIGHYLSNPAELAVLLVQIITFVPLMIVSIMYHIPIKSGYFLGDFVIYTIVLVLYSAGMTQLILFWSVYSLVFEYHFLRYLDQITFGSISSFYYRNFLACENEPDSWYMNPNYHLDNKNEKYTLVAFNKCPLGTVPNGTFCERKKYYESNFCLQPSIYQSYLGQTVKGNKTLDLNQFRPEYIKQDSFSKQITVDEYKSNIISNRNKCEAVFRNRDSLIKAICIDKNSEIETAKDNLCARHFCVDKSEPFCHLYKGNQKKLDSQSHADNSNIFVIMNILIVIAILTLTVTNYVKSNVP
jgi:hypothetical protein